MVFRGTLVGPGIGSTNNDAIFRQDAGGAVTRIIGEGEMVPDVNLPLLFVGAQHNLLDDGSVVFSAIFGAGSTTGNDGVILHAAPGQPVKTLLREGQAIGTTGFNLGPSSIEPGSGVPPQPSFAVGDLNGDGIPDVITAGTAVDVVPSAGGAPAKAVVYLLDGEPRLGAKEGDPIPGLEGQVFGDVGFGFTIAGVSLNNGITFLGSGSNGIPVGVFQQPLDGPARALVVDGDKASQFGKGFVFTDFSNPVVSRDGTVYFNGNAIKDRPGGTPQFRSGLFVIPSRADGKSKPALVVGRDRGAAGIPGPVVYSGAGGVDTIAGPNGLLTGIYVDLFNRKRPDDPQPEALYVRDKKMKLIAVEGGAAPGAGNGVTIVEHESSIGDDFVDFFWSALLAEDDEEFEAIFDSFLAGKKPSTELLLRIPSVLDLVGGGTRTATDVARFPTVVRGAGAAKLAGASGLVLECDFKESPGGILFAPQNKPPIYNPDIIVQDGAAFVGDNIKGEDAQQIPATLTAPATRDFLIILQNDANVSDSLIFKAKPPTFAGDDRAILFLDNEVDVSGDVYGSSGYRTATLPPNASTTLTMRIMLPQGFKKFEIPGKNATSKLKLKLQLESLDGSAKDEFRMNIQVQ